MYGAIPAFVHFCLFISFLFLLLVSLSVPIIHSIWLMRANIHVGVSFASASSSMTFGVWGLCVGRGATHLFGLEADFDGDCTKPKLGYSTEFSSNTHIKNLIHSDTARSLVLFPLATGLTFLALVSSIILHLRYGPETKTRTGRIFSVVELVSTSLASFFTSLAFIMSIVVDARASHSANKSHGIVSITYGSAVWLALVAAILLWFASVASCCIVLRERRRRRPTEKY